MNSIHADENGYNAEKRELNLSHRNLRELDTATIATYECTEYLDVSHNRLKHLEWITAFPHLRCLIMDDNRLREAHLEKLKVSLPKITTLTLNKNELSDLDTTANIIKQIFPNLVYLSLHGNPMCPDNLCLQPFSEFVPYEYSHYRRILKNSLPFLKFLDHFSLESLHSHAQTAEQVNRQTSKDPHQHLWSKLKSFLTVHNRNTGGSNCNGNISTLPECAASSSCVRPCASTFDSTYRGVHSEGNRFITNSDL